MTCEQMCAVMSSREVAERLMLLQIEHENIETAEAKKQAFVNRKALKTSERIGKRGKTN